MSNRKHAGWHEKHTGSETDPAAVWVPVAKLKAWAKNPRKNDKAVEKVAESIRTFGFGAPLLARKANGEIIAGHTRLRAAVSLGLDVVPVRYLELDESQAHLLALADNKLGEIAQWDDALLGSVLADLKAEGAALETSGFADDELATLLADSSASSSLENDESIDDVPEPPREPVTKRGDIWQLGQHRIMCGDCRNADDVARLLGSTKINVAFTSPPYASQRKYDESSGFKPIHPDEFVAWFEAVQANVRTHLADDGSWFVNIKEHCDDGQRSLYVKDLTIAHVRQWRWLFVDEFCWRNTKNGTPGGWPNRMKNAWEPVFHFAMRAAIKFIVENVSVASSAVFEYSAETAKSGTGSGLLGERAGEFSEGMARPSNVVECAAASESLHSAAFPVALPEFFIKAFSDACDAVYDPFMGSGTTLIACEREGRIAFGTEISPAYCDVIIARWEALTGKKAERIDGQLREA